MTSGPCLGLPFWSKGIERLPTPDQSQHEWRRNTWNPLQKYQPVAWKSQLVLGPHHSCLPTISEFLFFCSKIQSNSISHNSSVMFTCIPYLANQIPQRFFFFLQQKRREQTIKETSNQTNHSTRGNHIENQLLKLQQNLLHFAWIVI